MVTRTPVLPREGFYIDPLARWIRSTLLNPYWSLSVWMLLLIHSRGFRASSSTENSSHWLWIIARMAIILFFIGSGISINDMITAGCLNNWVQDDSWDWDKEIVLVTGGSSGIGASVVRHLTARNPQTRVVIVDYNAPSAQMLSNRQISFYQVDLSNSQNVKTLCETIRHEIGHPTVLVNNAGLTRGQTVMEGTYHDVEVTFRTNVIASFLLAKEFLPHMVAVNHGHVIATASMSALIAPAGLADYAATKAGIVTLQETLRQELRFRHNAHKVRASTAILGFIQTPMFKGNTQQPHFLLPLMHVDTIGEAIVDTLYSGNSQTIWYPGILRYLACLRAGPEWLMEIFRNGTQRLEVDYIGRQQIDSTGQLKVVPGTEA